MNTDRLTNDDDAETIQTNPKSWIAWKREFEKARQWNALLELELANLRQIKPTCWVCSQLMEPRGEDGTDFICVNCDRAYRESQSMLMKTIESRDAFAEESARLGRYVLKLGALLGCADGDDTPEERIQELVEEPGRFQAAIYLRLCKEVPEATIDGGGCDSGDPLDVTLAEIGQAFAWVEDRHNEYIEKIEAERDGALQESVTCRLAMHEQIDGYQATVEENAELKERLSNFYLTIPSMREERDKLAADFKQAEEGRQTNGKMYEECVKERDNMREGLRAVRRAWHRQMEVGCTCYGDPEGDCAYCNESNRMSAVFHALLGGESEEAPKIANAEANQ